MLKLPHKQKNSEYRDFNEKMWGVEELVVRGKNALHHSWQHVLYTTPYTVFSDILTFHASGDGREMRLNAHCVSRTLSLLGWNDNFEEFWGLSALGVVASCYCFWFPSQLCRFHPWQEIFPNAHELSCAAHHTFLIDTSFMPGSRSCLQILINYFLCAVCSTEQRFGMC